MASDLISATSLWLLNTAIGVGAVAAVSVYLFTAFFACHVSMQRHCHAWPWLSELSSVIQSRFTLSLSRVFTVASLVKPEDTFNPSFKAILYSASWVRKVANGQRASLLSFVPTLMVQHFICTWYTFFAFVWLWVEQAWVFFFSFLFSQCFFWAVMDVMMLECV